MRGISWLTVTSSRKTLLHAVGWLVGWMVSYYFVCLFVCLSISQLVTAARPADGTSMSTHNPTRFENKENCQMVNSRCETLKPYRASILSSATQEYDVSHIIRSKSCNHGMDLSRIRV
jgi:hypothetical protein